MEKKQQLNVSVDPSWRSRLEVLAAEETLRLGRMVSVADLVRQAVATTYELGASQTTVTHTTREECDAAVADQLALGAVCIRSDEPLSGSYGTICFFEDREDEAVYHRWFRYRHDLDCDVVLHTSGEAWLDILEAAINAKQTILPADRPRLMQLGFTLVKTRTTHCVAFRAIAASNDLVARFKERSPIAAP